MSTEIATRREAKKGKKMLPRDQPISPDGISGWIMSAVFILVTTSAIPAAYSPLPYIINPASSFGGLVSITAVYAFNLFTTVSTFAINLVKKSIKYLYVIVILAFILQAVVMLNETDSQIIKMTDKGATKYLLPAYHSVALPVARFSQVTYNMGICWFDLQVMYRNILIKNTVDVMLDCGEQDWQLVVNSTVKFIGDTLSLPIVFAQNGGQQPFEIQQVIQSAAGVIVAFKPMFQCSCAELEFAYDIFFDTFNNTNIHATIDRAINAIYYYPLNITAGAVDALFGVGPLAYDCNNADINIELQCSLTRPPYLIPMRDAISEMATFGSKFVEDEVNLLVRVFIDETWYGGTPFVFHDILAAPMRITAHVIFDTMDLLTHIDLIFTPRVLYLRISPINQLIQEGEKFCDGIETFFSTFEDVYMTNLAIMLAETARMSFYALDELKNFAIALFYEPFEVTSLRNYFLDFNTTRWETSYIAFREATFALFAAIDDRSEEVAEELVLVLESIARVFLKSIQLLATEPSGAQINDFVINTLPPYVNNVSLHIHGMFVASGNFFRQFDETDSCGYNVVYPATISTLTNPSGHIICEMSNIFETIGQLVRSSIMQVTNTLFSAYSDTVNGVTINTITPYVNSFYNWFIGELGTIYNNSINSVGGLMASFFGDISCPCTSGSRCSSGNIGMESTTVRGNVRQVIVASIDGTVGIIYHGPAFVVKMIKVIVDAGPTYTSSEISSIICQFLTGMYDFVGRLAYILKSIGDAFDCLLGGDGATHINVLGGTVYYIFFDADNSNSLRNLICPIVDFILQVINFFYGFVSQGLKYLTDLIVEGAKAVTNILIDLVNSMIQKLNAGLAYIETAINTILIGIRMIICFLNQMAGIFDCLTQISISIPIKRFDLNIPGIDLSFSINFGLLGTLRVPLKIPGWTIPFYFPVPDFSKITNAINCLTAGFNGLGSGCGSGCGSGPIQPSICSANVDIAGIPSISRLNKRDAFTDAMANDTVYMDIMQNYTLVVCEVYQKIAQNESLQPELRQLYAKEWMSCVFSAQMMFATNLMLFRNFTNDWLPPTTLMSIGDVAAGCLDMADKLYYPVSNEISCYGAQFEALLKYNQTTIMTNSCMPWDQLYEERNLTSEWVYRVGHALEVIRGEWEEKWWEAKLNATNGTDIFSTFSYYDLLSGVWNGLSGLSDLIFNPQPGTNVSLYDSVNLTVTAYQDTVGNTTAKRFYADYLEPIIFHETSLSNQLENRNVMGFNATDKWMNLRSSVMTYWETKKSQVIDFFRPKTPRAIANRHSLSALSAVLYGAYNEYSLKYDLFKSDDLKGAYTNGSRSQEMLMGLATVNEQSLNTIEGIYSEWLSATPLGKDKIKAVLQNQLTQVRTGSVGMAKRTDDTHESDICGIPTVDGSTTCINCTLIRTSLDILIDRTSQCVAITKLNFNLFNDEFFSPFVQIITNPFTMLDSRTDGLFSQWMNEVALINFTLISKDYNETGANMFQLLESYTQHIQGYGSDSIVSLIHANGTNATIPRVVVNADSITEAEETVNDSKQFSFIIYPTKAIAIYVDANIVKPAMSAILGIKFSVTGIVGKIRSLFADGVSVSTSNSIYYWLNFFVSRIPTMDCQVLAERGIGVGNLALTTVLVGLGYLLFVGIAARISYVLLALVAPLSLLSPYLIISINYGVSPLMIPALPFCLADDLYGYVKYLDVDCVSWNRWFPGLTPIECPTIDTDYTRSILECSVEPYYFDNPWRVFYYLLDSLAPSVMDYIRGNENYLSATLRNIDGMQIMMTFPYPAGQPTDEYTTCFKLRAYNLYVFFLYAQVLGLLGFTVAIVSVLTVTFLGGVVYFTGLLCMSMSGIISGANVYSVSGIYSDPKIYARNNLAGHMGDAPTEAASSGASPAASRYISDGEVKKLVASPSQGRSTITRRRTPEDTEDRPVTPPRRTHNSLLSTIIARLKSKKE